MKKCSKCGVERDASQFQKRMASKDFLTSSCKACLKEYDKKRDQDPSRIQMKKDYAMTEKGKAARGRAQQKWLESNPIKRAVHITTGNAIRDGKLIKQPCEYCEDKVVHAHHDDYTKPLEVRWLCSKCHEKWHEENGEGLNADENLGHNLNNSDPLDVG